MSIETFLKKIPINTLVLVTLVVLLVIIVLINSVFTIPDMKKELKVKKERFQDSPTRCRDYDYNCPTDNGCMIDEHYGWCKNKDCKSFDDKNCPVDKHCKVVDGKCKYKTCSDFKTINECDSNNDRCYVYEDGSDKIVCKNQPCEHREINCMQDNFCYEDYSDTQGTFCNSVECSNFNDDKDLCNESPHCNFNDESNMCLKKECNDYKGDDIWTCPTAYQCDLNYDTGIEKCVNKKSDFYYPPDIDYPQMDPNPDGDQPQPCFNYDKYGCPEDRCKWDNYMLMCNPLDQGAPSVNPPVYPTSATPTGGGLPEPTNKSDTPGQGDGPGDGSGDWSRTTTTTTTPLTTTTTTTTEPAPTEPEPTAAPITTTTTTTTQPVTTTQTTKQYISTMPAPVTPPAPLYGIKTGNYKGLGNIFLPMMKVNEGNRKDTITKIKVNNNPVFTEEKEKD